jgi:hypothetical protein
VVEPIQALHKESHMRYPAVFAALILALALAPFQTDASPKGSVTMGTPTITPAPKKVQEEDGCRVLAKLTFSSCGLGDTETGGSRKQDSQEFKDGVAICNGAAQVARATCEQGLLEAYVDRTGKGMCPDLAVFQTDAITFGCGLHTKDPALLKKCERWAEVGTAKFVVWCEEREAEARERAKAGSADL